MYINAETVFNKIAFDSKYSTVKTIVISTMVVDAELCKRAI
jgi:hypothetical protein